MSIEINLKSPHKKELADFLISIANLIKASSNESITINGEVKFNKSD